MKRSCEKVSFELGVIERELRMVRAVNRRRRKLFVRQSLRKKRRVSDAETDTRLSARTVYLGIFICSMAVNQ